MAIIRVNHQELKNAATSVRKYCALQENKMRLANGEVKMMLYNGWKGADADAYAQKWSGVNTSGSVAQDLKKSLESSADALDQTAAAYQKAQEDAYNRAYYLPKIW